MKSYLGTKELKALKKKLPHGAIKKISIKTSLDQSTVSKVLSGKFYNKVVIDQALELIKTMEMEKTSIHEQIKKVTNY